MSLTVYRVLLGLLYAPGILAGGAYLYLYKAWQVRRWLASPVARDASGWVLVLWAVYLWLAYRLAAAIIAGRGQVPKGADLWISLVVFAAIDGALIHRFAQFVRTLRHERTHPTMVCPRCHGQGVVERRVARPGETAAPS